MTSHRETASIVSSCSSNSSSSSSY